MGNTETTEENGEESKSFEHLSVKPIKRELAGQRSSDTSSLRSREFVFKGKDALPNLLAMSKKVVDKCNSCLALGESILNELESQLMRTDNLKSTLDTIQTFMLETQLFLINVKQPFYKRILPCFNKKKIHLKSPELWSSQMMLQAEKEMDLSISVMQQFGGGTSNFEAEFDWSSMLDNSPTSKMLQENLLTAGEKLCIVKEMSLSIMLELLLQTKEIPKVLNSLDMMNVEIELFDKKNKKLHQV